MVEALRSVFFLLLGVGLLVTGNGLIGIVLPLRLSAEQVSAETTGLVMSSYYAGFIIGCYLAQKIIRHVGHVRAFAAFAAILTAAFMLHALWFNPVAWAVFRVLTGLCMAGLYATIESWLNVRSQAQTRGQILAFYSFTVYLGGGVGQLLVNVADVSSATLFCLGALLSVLSMVPVVLTKGGGVDLEIIKSLPLRALYEASPLGLVVTVGAGLLSGAFASLGAVYATSIGLSVRDVSIFMGAQVIGGFLLQWPIGRLSDRFDRRTILLWVMIACVLNTIALTVMGFYGAVLIPMVIAIALLGGVIAAIYPLAVAHSFDYIEKDQMVAANSKLLLIWGVGATIGPLIAAAVMGQVGGWGLFLFLATVSVGLTIFTRYRMGQRIAKPAAEQSEFVPVTPTTAVSGGLDPRAEPLPEFSYDDVDPGDR